MLLVVFLDNNRSDWGEMESQWISHCISLMAKDAEYYSYIFIGHLHFFQGLFVQFTCHMQNETRPWFSVAFQHSQYSFLSEVLLQWSLRTLTGL